MKRITLALAVACMLVLGGGCACWPGLYAPFGPGTLCDGGGCGPACAQPGGESCASCGRSSCGGCAAPSNAPCGPLTWLFAIFAHGYCGDGCGETYWGDFHGDPPDYCEPCDRLGRWTGEGASGQVAGGSPAGGCATGHCTGAPKTIDYTFQRGRRIVPGSERVVPGSERVVPGSERVVSTTGGRSRPTPAKPIARTVSARHRVKAVH